MTALPNAYYPETTWHDDMELGAAEIALAAQKLRPQRHCRTYASGATWAKDYIAGDTGDTFNLYDTSALAHADLIRGIAAAGSPAGLAVGSGAARADLKRQVQTGAQPGRRGRLPRRRRSTPTSTSTRTRSACSRPRRCTAQASGDTAYAAFATEQRDWLLGANAWGASFMVGQGDTVPACMQHQVANLARTTRRSARSSTGRTTPASSTAASAPTRTAW